MVKSYLRYEPRAVFGVIVSPDANISFDATGKLLFAPALESVNIWNIRQGVCVTTLTLAQSRPALAVTSIVPFPSSRIASGHADGSIRIWDCTKGTCETTLNGHKGATTALRHNSLGSLLASGSKDTDIILWDVVAESGIYRLRGHKDQVTDILFIDSGKKLVSSSKDKFLRVWDLDTQHCMQIVGGYHSEIWSMDVDPEEKYLVAGSADMELKCYRIRKEPKDIQCLTQNGLLNKWEVLIPLGEICRKNKDSKDRIATVRFNKSGRILCWQEAGKIIEVYRVLSDRDSERKAKRRLNRKKEVTSSVPNGVSALSLDQKEKSTIIARDVFKFLHMLRTSKKISSFCLSPVIPTTGALASLAVSLNNNSLEVYSVMESTSSKVLSIDLPGHRADIRSVALSSDNTLFMSTSHNAVKIWNPSTAACLRTIESEFGTCATFVPGNQYGLVGTKHGKLEIIDIGSGTCVEVIQAHTDFIGSVKLIPDGNGFVTGSIDHHVKFWEYQLVEKPGQEVKQLTAVNVRALTMNEEVTVVSVSPDAKYIAVALLDYTVKVYFMDTFKFFLSLYGHKLPVLGMDISSDADLIVTGSADKNMKIWGMDFGDCHKSIFAHADSVMAVQFVPKTHYVFTVGKDRLVKYWDADKFELLLTLEGHHAYIWCIAISCYGDFLLTGSSDRSLRRWDRTDEPFFIEEEREKRLDEMFESVIDDPSESRHAPKQEVPEEGAVGVAGKMTQETLTATDLIIEALDMASVEVGRISQHKDAKTNGHAINFQPNILMLGLSPSDYVLHTLSNVHTNDLEQTLLCLPFSDALSLMSYLKDWTSYPDKVELVSRITTILLQTHYNQLITTVAARSILIILKDTLKSRIQGTKDVLGFNLAAMNHLKQLMSHQSDAPFRDAKTKLMEIRFRHSKRHEKVDPIEQKKRKKRRKSSSSCIL